MACYNTYCKITFIKGYNMRVLDDPKQYSAEELSDLFSEISKKFYQIEKNSDLEIPKSLLTFQSTNHKNRTLLHMLANAYASNAEGLTALTSLIHLLIQNGAQVNATDLKGKTPLMLAADNQLGGVSGRVQPMQVLIDNQADVNALDNNGQSALYHALCRFGLAYTSDPIREASAVLLVNSGASITENIREVFADELQNFNLEQSGFGMKR